MTKAERIRKLFGRGLPVAEIARQIGCHPAYVRVAARQRKGGSSNADKRYYEANRETLIEKSARRVVAWRLRQKKLEAAE